VQTFAYQKDYPKVFEASLYGRGLQGDPEAEILC